MPTDTYFQRAISRLGLRAECVDVTRDRISHYVVHGENPTVPPIHFLVTSAGNVYISLPEVATLSGPDRVRIRTILRMLTSANVR